MAETLRGNIVDVANELNKLLMLTNDPDEAAKIRKLRRVLRVLLEEVIRQEISPRTVAFREAVADLKEAQKAIAEAKEDLQKTVDAINTVVLAAKAVDKIVRIGIDLIA